MPISASDVRQAYGTPIDYGNVIETALDRQRRQALENQQLKLQQEDRDIRNAQLINETMKDLRGYNGTYYDDIKHQKLADIHGALADAKAKNPKMTLAQEYMLANQMIGDVSRQDEQAKLVKAMADQEAKRVAKDVQGLDEVTLSRDLEKSAYQNDKINPDFQSIIGRNARDLGFTGNHYSFNEAAKKKILSDIDYTRERQNDVKVGGRTFEDEKGTPYGFEFNGTDLVPKTEPTEVNYTYNKGLNAYNASRLENLVPLKTLNAYAQSNDPEHPEDGVNDFAHKLHNEMVHLQNTDEVAKGMDGETLVRYAGTKFLRDLHIPHGYKDVTEQRNKEDIATQSARISLEKAKAEKPTEYNVLRLDKAIGGDKGAIDTYPNYVGKETNNGVDINARLLSSGLKDNMIITSSADGKTLGKKLFISNDGSKYYVTDVTIENKGILGGRTVSEAPLLKEIGEDEARNLQIIANGQLKDSKSVIAPKPPATKTTREKAKNFKTPYSE